MNTNEHIGNMPVPWTELGTPCPATLTNCQLIGDTWTSGKILPVPENDRQMFDDFLAVCSDSERVTIETFWFDRDGWRDDNDQPIEVSAWRRIPMDGIDEAVRLGDQP